MKTRCCSTGSRSPGIGRGCRRRPSLHCRTAIERRDSFAEAHYLLGLVYRDVRNFDAATASLEQALRIDPGLTAAREELADLHRTQGRTVDEMQQLQSARGPR